MFLAVQSLNCSRKVLRRISDQYLNLYNSAPDSIEWFYPWILDIRAWRGGPLSVNFLNMGIESDLHDWSFALLKSDIILQELFKKAAYLSSGSIDTRPTFQRDAEDDEILGYSNMANEFNWKAIQLGRGSASKGAAYGSMVMPVKKGAKRVRKPLELLLPKVRLNSQSIHSQFSRTSAILCKQNTWCTGGIHGLLLQKCICQLSTANPPVLRIIS